MKKRLFVGIDTSKQGHQVSLMNPTKTKEDLYINNDQEGFDRLTKVLSQYREQGYQVTVGCEPCGHYWENLGYGLLEEGYDVRLVNPFHVNRYKEIFDNSPQKDDRKDSRVIATLVKEGRSLHNNLPHNSYAELRHLTHLREQLLKEGTRLRNRLHGWIDRYFPEYTKLFSDLFCTTCLGLLKKYGGPQQIREASLRELTEEVRSLSRGKLGKNRAQQIQGRATRTIGQTVAPKAARAELNWLLVRIDSWQGEVKGVEGLIKNELSQQKEDKYLQSIPCVGWWGAAVFLGELGDVRKYPRARSIEKLAGLNLYCKQSGKMKSRLKITHRGRSLLRKMAYQLAVSGTHGSEEFSEFYQRKINKGTPKVSALVALGAKILRVMYGVVKNEEEYRPLKERAGDAAGFQQGPC